MAPNNTHPEAQTGRRPGAGALVGGTLFIGLITACAMIIAYNGLFALAEYGGGENGFPHVFPVAYTLLVLMAFWVSYMLRDAAPRDRLWIDIGLIPFLIVFAAAVMVLHNLGMFDPETGTFPERAANVIVAVAPLVPLLIAILLWITVRAHLRRRSRAVRRPSPSADRTTVLHGRHPETAEPEPLQTRLLSFGSEEPEDDTETEELPSVGEHRGEAVTDETPEEGSEEESEEPTTLHRAPQEPAARAREGERETPLPAAAPPPRRPEPPTEPEDSAAVPLPRRSPNGGNPIKHAAEHPPVVPGAAAPTPEPPQEEKEEFSPVVVPDDLADEGFEHEPPPGDPATDEAEAPAASVEAPAEPQAPAEPEELSLRSEATVPPEHESAVSTDPDTEIATGIVTEDDVASEPDTEDTPAVWEPPTEEDDARNILADYVPPVWTPPDEDVPSPEQASEEAPSLDHDTGPEVRAAFHRMESAPMAPEGSDDAEATRGPADEPEKDRTTTRAELDEEDGEPLPEAEELPPQESEPPKKPAARPNAPSGETLRKRPMILKPPRPPMPDFESGPPSRRVRSEPLRPED